MRRLRWEQPNEPLPKRPYRDSVIFYAALSGVIVLVAYLTEGRILPGDGEVGALIIAIAFFALATSWSIWKWRKRLQEASDPEGAAARSRAAGRTRRKR